MAVVEREGVRIARSEAPIEFAPVEKAQPPEKVHRIQALDGLRFVAVAAVLAFHFGVPGAQAGFLGVDLFFVLSGFLITSILLKQVEIGKVGLADFWTRRVRRLAPAVLLMLAAIIAWGALDAAMTSRDDLRGDVTATAAYVANWHFIGTSSYFHASGDKSVLLHMWTLAVEEQFYVLWPLALLLIVLLVPRRLRLTFVAAVAVCGLLVSAWRLQSLWAGSGASDRAYMGTDSRMFGPLAGAVVAVMLVRARRLGASRWLNTTAMLTGSAILVWAMFALGSTDGPTDAYAKGGALLVALGSAAVIWAVSTRTSRVSAILALPPLAYLGRISYGIYIWHWPLVIWAGNGWIDSSGFPAALRVLVLTIATVAIAALSYHAVEKPIRYGTIGRRLKGRWIAVLLPAALAALIVVNTSVVVPHAGAKISVVAKTGAVPGKPKSGHTRAITVTKTVVLVGDSVPQVLSTDFADDAARHGYVVIRATAGGCPATAVSKFYSNGVRFTKNTCPTMAIRQDAKIKKFRPALVIWWSRYEVAPRVGPDGKLLPLGSKAYFRVQEASFERRARALTKRGARLVAVQIERPGPMLAIHNPSEEDFLVGQTLLHRWYVVKAWNAFLARHEGPKVYSFSVDQIVCHDVKDPCDDALPNGKPARPDGIHYLGGSGPRVASYVLERALRITGLEPERPSSGTTSSPVRRT